MDKQDLLSPQEIKRLPAWWQVAFAARCLRLAICRAPTAGEVNSYDPLFLNAILTAEQFALNPPVQVARYPSSAQRLSPEALQQPLSQLAVLHWNSCKLRASTEAACLEAAVCEATAVAEPEDQDYAERAALARVRADNLLAKTEQAAALSEEAVRESHESVVASRQEQIAELNEAAKATLASSLSYRVDASAFQMYTEAIKTDSEFEVFAWLTLLTRRSASASAQCVHFDAGSWPLAKAVSEPHFPRNWAELQAICPLTTRAEIVRTALGLSAVELLLAAAQLMGELTVVFDEYIGAPAEHTIVPAALRACRFAVLSQGYEQQSRASFLTTLREELGLLSIAANAYARPWSSVPPEWLLGIHHEQSARDGRLDEKRRATVDKIDAASWATVNERRVELIRKKYRGSGLTDAEGAELDSLQAFADRYLDQSHAPQLLSAEERAILASIIRK